MTDLPDSLTLEPQRMGTLLAVGILGAVTVAFFFATLYVHWLVWILFLVSACAFCVVAFAALPGRSYVRLEREGFVIRTPFRLRRFAWTDVTPFVAAPLSGGQLVVFRSRSAPGAALPPTPEPTAQDIAEGADALPRTYGHDADQLARLMNDWRTRATG